MNIPHCHILHELLGVLLHRRCHREIVRGRRCGHERKGVRASGNLRQNRRHFFRGGRLFSDCVIKELHTDETTGMKEINDQRLWWKVDQE
jgi:hypothetical protein